MPLTDLIPDLPAAAYHATEAVSSGRLADFARSPRGYHLRNDPAYKRQSAGLTFGSLVHLVTLEPHRRIELAVDSPVNPSTGRPYGSDTTKAAAWRAECIAANRTPTDAADLTLAELLASNCREVCPALTPDGPAPGWQTEATLRCSDPIVGLCQARPDLINVEQRAIIDLKTTKSLDGFRFAVRDYSYDLQAAWYLTLAEALPDNTEAWSWEWLVVETEAPYRATLVRWASVIAAARGRIQPLLAKLAECRATGLWPMTLAGGLIDYDR